MFQNFLKCLINNFEIWKKQIIFCKKIDIFRFSDFYFWSEFPFGSVLQAGALPRNDFVSFARVGVERERPWRLRHRQKRVVVFVAYIVARVAVDFASEREFLFYSPRATHQFQLKKEENNLKDDSDLQNWHCGENDNEWNFKY